MKRKVAGKPYIHKTFNDNADDKGQASLGCLS